MSLVTSISAPSASELYRSARTHWPIVRVGSDAGRLAMGLNTTGMKSHCGFVVELGVVDRSIVNSAWGAHSPASASGNFCRPYSANPMAKNMLHDTWKMREY